MMCTQTQIQSCFQYSDSVLIHSQNYLEKHEEVVLKFIAKVTRCKEENYRSTMDYVLCACFPIFRTPCHRYYAEKGKAMREIHTAAELSEIDHMFLMTLMAVVQAAKKMAK
jgi:hypothetical protein